MGSDPDVQRRAACGDRAAFEELPSDHLPELEADVRLRAGRLVRSRGSITDLVQSVCREVLENADRFQHPGDGAFRRWLHATGLREMSDRRESLLAQKRDVLREEPPVARAPGDEDGSERLLRVYGRFSTPSRHAMVREEIDRIEAAFDALPEEYVQVISPARVAGLSRAEISVEMGRSEGAVRNLLHRALVKTSALLEQGAGDPEGSGV